MFSIGGVSSAADPALGNTKSLKSDGFLRFFVSKSQHRMKQGIFGGQDSVKIALKSYLEVILTSKDAFLHPMLRF